MQKTRQQNMEYDMARFYMIDASIDESKKRKHGTKTQAMKVDTYQLINANDTLKRMKISVFASGEVTCDCCDYKFRCYKNNILCKHCLYILQIGLKLKQILLIDLLTMICIFNDEEF